MSFIANTAFEARVTNGRNDDLINVTGRFQTTSGASFEDADCSAGFLCTARANLPCAGFTGVNNENAYYMVAATAAATADDVIYACNPYDSPVLKSGNNQFAVGSETLGLGIPAGRNGTFSVVEFDGRNIYRFGQGDLSAAIGSNTYFTIADGLLVPAASAPTTTGAVYFKLHGTGKFTAGTTAGATYYDVKAMKVSTVAGG